MVKKLFQSVLCMMMSGLMVMPAFAAEGNEAAGARNGTETSLAAPALSMTLDFEEAALGVYTAAGGEGTQGYVVSDGGGLKLDMSIDNLSDASMEVIDDTTEKFGGKVLKVNSYSSTATSEVYARLLPAEKTVDLKGNEGFTTQDADGRYDRGYRVHYSFDYYLDPDSAKSGSTYGLYNSYQSLWWRASTADATGTRVTEDILEATTTSHSNIGWSHTVAKDTETAGTASIGWRDSGWNQTNHPDAIHMDYILDLETGELWMYRNGELCATRDFSEVPRSSFKQASSYYYRDLQTANSILMVLRQKGGTGDGKSATYYDNFKVDMYGSDVSAKQLRELASDRTRGSLAGSAVTRSMSCGYASASASGLTSTNMGVAEGEGATYSNDNGRIKAANGAGATSGGYLSLEPSSYNTHATLTARSKYLPKEPAGNAVSENNIGVGYLRFGYNRESDLAADGTTKQYALHPVDFMDYMVFSTDIEIDAATQDAVNLEAQWYQFDSNRGYGTPPYTVPGTADRYDATFLRFDQADGAKTIKAFDESIEGLTWTPGVTYHVDYVVDMNRDKAYVILNGEKIAEDSTAVMSQKGRMPRIRARFATANATERFYLDNIDWNFYNGLYTTFDELAEEKTVSPAAIADDASAVLSDGTVTVTARLGAFVPYTGRKVLIALYQNYGDEDSRMLDAAICEYATSDDDFTAELDAGEETSALSVKMYLWEDMSTLKPIGKALTVDVE